MICTAKYPKGGIQYFRKFAIFHQVAAMGGYIPPPDSPPRLLETFQTDKSEFMKSRRKHTIEILPIYQTALPS